MEVITAKLQNIEARLSKLSINRIDEMERKLNTVIANKELNSQKFISTDRIKVIEQKLEEVSKLSKANSESISKLEGSEAKIEEGGPVDSNSQQATPKKETVSKIKEEARTFISSTTVHSVSRILKTDNLLIKLVWTVMIIVSVSFGLSNISRTITDFNKYDVITNIDRVTPTEVTFPAITVCLRGIYNKSYYINNTFIRSEITTDSHIKGFIYQETNLSKLDYFKLPHRIEDCVRFNGAMNKELETVRDTLVFINLVISGGYDEKLTESKSIKYHKFTREIRIYAADNSVNSFLNMVPLILEENIVYRLSVERTEIEKKLGQPYSQCDESLNRTYRQVNCIEECINKEIKIKYNCSIPSFYTVKGLVPCFEETDLEDENGAWFNNVFKTRKRLDEFRYSCAEKCPMECETSKIRLQIARSSSNPANLKQTHLLIGFSDLSYHKITQIPKMNEFSLISGIGGSLGLFIGVKFLSLVEILEFFIEVFFVLFINHSDPQ